MRSVPDRWVPLFEYLSVLLEPIVELGLPRSWIPVEANGPDGEKWTSLRPLTVPLGGRDPVRDVARAVATLCSATGQTPDPGPTSQRRRGIYYAPCALHAPRRNDQCVAALGAIVLDLDERSIGSRSAVLRALARAPDPTAVVHSGGGVQAAYVLREAVVFDRRDESGLTKTVRSYLRASIGLERLTQADETWWPSHLYRCPGTFHLKDPDRPVLVTVRVAAGRRYNLADFDEVAGGVADDDVEPNVAVLIARLLGRSGARNVRRPTSPLRSEVRADGRRHFTLPRKVSPGIVRLLNTGRHSRYERRDGSLDRSRAVYAAALSLLSADLDEDTVASTIAESALSGAVECRGDDGARWLGFQIAAARKYLSRCRPATGGAR